ncbi:condensation domain-containing protein, partial [Burkholderia sp. SIMBA_024]|uniref:condensation domain-containing protein n=1 Tax=Burkholderia sp. SIMBA_024 TaxID=3085768 RepID=UPI00397E3AEF
LPTDRTRPAVQKYEGDVVRFTIPAAQSEGLKRLANKHGATLYMVMLAAYKTFLHRYSGQEDIIVGSPIAGRTHVDTDPLI